MDRLSGNSPVKRVRGTATLAKEKIIKAAIAEFALKGLDGARVDEVARRSGVNKSLLYQYVGNKERLFTAALEATYGTIRERQRAFLARQKDPEAGLRQLVQLFMSIWVEHPEWGKLLASENIHGGRHVKRSKPIGEMYVQLIEALNDLLRRGVEQGVFRPNIDAVDLYISISSLAAYFVAHQHTLNALFNVDVMEQRRLRQREQHVIEMIMRYVASEPGSTGSPGVGRKPKAAKPRATSVPSR